MSDPLADPRAHDLISAVPAEVDSLAGQFGRVAAQAQMVLGGIRGASATAAWTGQAADLFHEQLGKLPGDLEKVAQSYTDAATALGGYAGRLDPLRRQFLTLQPQLTAAQGAVRAAQGSLDTATGNLRTAIAAPGAKPTSAAVVSARTAVTGAGGALSRAQDDLTGLSGQAFRILDEFDTIRGRARSAMSRAAGLAPQDNSSWFSSLVSGFVHVVQDAGKFIAAMGVGVYDAAIRLPADFAAVWQHPFSLEAWGHLAGDLGTVVGTIALVVSIAVCPLDAFGLEGAASVLSRAGTLIDYGATGLAAGKTGIDLGLYQEGRGSFSGVLVDGLSLGAGFVKIPGLKSAQSDAGALDNGASAIADYAAARASGQTATQAYSMLSATQLQGLRSSTVQTIQNAATGQGLSYLRSALHGAASTTARHEHSLDALNSLAHWTPERAKDVATHPDENSFTPAAIGGAR